ncbi:hypothetical protein WAI453_008271 [Rhynchosporium graminicola]
MGFHSQVNNAMISVPDFRRTFGLIPGVGHASHSTIGLLSAQRISLIFLRGNTTAGINLGIVFGQLLSKAAVKE